MLFVLFMLLADCCCFTSRESECFKGVSVQNCVPPDPNVEFAVFWIFGLSLLYVQAKHPVLQMNP